MKKHLLTYGFGAAVVLSSPIAYLYYRHQKYSISQFVQYQHSPLPTRESMIERMKQNNFDCIIIGGGATGSSVALDAATRGLQCALIEENDFSSGTSGKSTKLLHGGVRYLEAAFKNFDLNQFKLVCEALEERAHMMKCSPFMSKPLPILIPMYNYFDMWYYRIGVKVYDWVADLICAFDTGLPSCYYFDKQNTLFSFPFLREKGLKGSVVYYDGQHNDARMNLHIALTSCMDNYVNSQKGAAIANYVKAMHFLKNKEGTELIGVHVMDKLTNQEFDIFGKVMINCAGPFADEIRRMADPACEPLIIPAAGSHITLPKSYTSSNFAVLFPSTDDNRVLYCLPWEDGTIVGTTDTVSKLTYFPTAKSQDVEFMFKEINKYLLSDEARLRRDLKSTWSGLRPLVKDPTKSKEKSADLVRSHIVVTDKGGLISILGGKWTTCRRMAQDTVDAALEYHRNKLSVKADCCTRNLLLIGSVDPSIPYNSRVKPMLNEEIALELCEAFPPLSILQASHLVRNYGYRAFDVCKISEENKSLLTPIVPDQLYLKAEIIHAIRYEMARLPSDVVGRRTRLAFIDAKQCETVMEEVIGYMKKELRWTDQQVEAARKDAVGFLQTMTIEDT